MLNRQKWAVFTVNLSLRQWLMETATHQVVVSELSRLRSLKNRVELNLRACYLMERAAPCSLDVKKKVYQRLGIFKDHLGPELGRFKRRFYHHENYTTPTTR